MKMARLVSHAKPILLLLGFLCSCATFARGQNVDSDSESNSNDDKPNVIVLLTDEHNLRTIGKYRDLLIKTTNSDEQAFPWGDKIRVATRNLNWLANTGATFTNFHTVSPLCTTSRGSLVTGTYPSFNGADGNHAPMHENVTTFAQVLQDEFNYTTSYMGKWHLNGLDKGAKNFGAPEGRSFGFQDTRYLWNRGHWKCLDDSKGWMKGYSFNNCVKKFKGDYKMKRVYNTDFLTDKAVEFIKAQKELNNKFALMVSYPDPHAPNKVRAPYDTMYDDTNFEFPRTAKVALKKEPAIPNWSYRDPKYRNVTASDADAQIDDIEASNDFQKTMRQNFGMIKLIDDSVGRILNAVHETGLTKNTILVFTSDHGDLMAEHGNYGKVLPYKTSAGIPFILRWPDKIKPKVVSSVFSSVDFVPTILNLVGAKSTEELDLPGIDASPDLLDAELWKSNSLQTRFIDGPNGRYAAALTERFKLVLNKKGTPWLFDLEKDPDELLNFYKSTEFYTEVSTRMQDDLVDAMAKHDFGLMKNKNPVYLDRPACEETLNNLGRSLPVDTCHDLAEDEAEAENYCAKESFQTTCPVTCNSCVEDSVGRMLLKNREITCDKQVRKKPNYYCKMKYVQLFCADTCSGFMSSLSNRALAGGKEIIQEDVRHPRRRLLPF